MNYFFLNWYDYLVEWFQDNRECQQIKVCLVEDDEEIGQLTKDVLEFKEDIICAETCSSAEDLYW